MSKDKTMFCLGYWKPILFNSPKNILDVKSVMMYSQCNIYIFCGINNKYKLLGLKLSAFYSKN